MNITSIESECDYDAALKRIEILMGAQLDTPEGDELDVLITLVDTYEAKHHPIALPKPIEAIIFRMDQMGLKRKT